MMFEETLNFIKTESWRLASAIIAVVVIYFLYKTCLNLLRRSGDELELEPHVRNALRLLLRVIALVITFMIVFQIFDLPTDLFVGGTALLGAAIGFGSSQTINNIVAGFYVLISQPFKVKDYVFFGDLEGQVEEISINYTNLYTPTFNLLKVPNTQVMNSRILNLTHEGFIKYTFNVSFDHTLSEKIILNQVILPAIEEFQSECGEENRLRCPEAYLEKANRLEMIYMIRLFIPKGEAKKLFILQPELLRLIMNRYNEVKTAS